MRPSDLITAGAGWYVERVSDVSVPPGAVRAAFRLFGADRPATRLLLMARTVASPSPAMRRLRERAVRAVRDYVTLVTEVPHLRELLRLDFCLLIGLYGEITGIDLASAVRAGLVDVYCHLAALVDAYDDVIDAPGAREQELREDDFRKGQLDELRERLTHALSARAHQSPAAAHLVDDLAAFEQAAWQSHRSMDLGTGLDASLEAVLLARHATSGALLRLAAHLWNALLGLPSGSAREIEDAAATFGVVAQFADDLIDWTADVGLAQNLLDAALRTNPCERQSALVAANHHPGWSLPIGRLRRLAPQSLALLNDARTACVRRYPTHPRFRPLVQFGDDVYRHLLPALPALDFSAFAAVREETQALLANTGSGPNDPAAKPGSGNPG